jgi:hypothetical protein
MPRSAIRISKSLTEFETRVPADTEDDNLPIEMPSLEQYVDRNEPLHSAIIPRLRLFAPDPDELDLPAHIAFRQPSHLAFPDHMQNLVPLNRSPRAIEGSKALTGIHPALDRSMVLLYDIVQVRAGSTATSAPKSPFLLQLRDHFPIRRITIHGDDSRPGMTGSLQGFLKESFGGSRVTLGGKPEVDRGTGRIHGTIPGIATSHPGKCRFRRPSRSRWSVSVRVGIFCSIRAHSAAPNATRSCGPQADLVPPAILQRPDMRGRTGDTNGPRKR